MGFFSDLLGGRQTVVPTTSKTVNEPPEYLKPFLQQIAEESRLLFSQRLPLIAGPNPYLEQVASGLQGIAGADPVQSANQSLQSAFQTASRDANNQFALSGRGRSGLSDAAISEGFARQAVPLINANQNRQLAALGALPGIGAQQQAYDQSLLREPFERLNLFSSGVRGSYIPGTGTSTSTQNQTFFDNPLMQLLGLGIQGAGTFASAFAGAGG